VIPDERKHETRKDDSGGAGTTRCRAAGATPPQAPLVLVPALLLVLIEVGWIVAIGVFVYRTVT
jgi:hypothetical protein